MRLTRKSVCKTLCGTNAAGAVHTLNMTQASMYYLPRSVGCVACLYYVLLKLKLFLLLISAICVMEPIFHSVKDEMFHSTFLCLVK